MPSLVKRSDSNANALFKIVVLSFVTLVVGIVTYFLILAHRNRKMFESSRMGSVDFTTDRSLLRDTTPLTDSTIHPSQSNAPMTRSTSSTVTLSSLRPGDLLFVRQRPVSDQMSRLLTSPRSVVTGILTGLPASGNLPSHVSMVLTPSSDWSKFEILDINSTNETCVTTLHKYLNSYPDAYYTIHYGLLSKPVPREVLISARRELIEQRVSYGTKLIFSNILPRKTEQFVRRRALSSQNLFGDTSSLGGFRVADRRRLAVAAFPLPSVSRGWNGLNSPKQTCSSLIYAVLEYCGFVAPFSTSCGSSCRAEPVFASESTGTSFGGHVWPHQHVLPLSTLSSAYSTYESEEEEDIVRIIEPFAILPADFLRSDFQWVDGVYIQSYGALRALL